ncbi:MAG: hypothetical protein LBP59_10470 [Planctomycetaceae bacterium]|jgi:hypothetical protein|nr:hypothetical protein [Planctomycetaceae bacterium]
MAKKFIDAANQEAFLTSIKIYIDERSTPNAANSFRVRDFVESVAGLSSIVDPLVRDLAIVLNDESNDGQSSIYKYDGEGWEYITAIEIDNRDFTTNPITIDELDTALQTLLDSLATAALNSNEVMELLIDTGFLNPFEGAVDLGTFSSSLFTSEIYTTTQFFKVESTPGDIRWSLSDKAAVHTYTVTVYDAAFAEVTSISFAGTDTTTYLDTTAYDGIYYVKVSSVLTATGEISAATFKFVSGI